MAELAIALAIAILTALLLGSLLGDAALRFRGGRLALDIVVQFRAGLGLWFTALVLARTGWLAPVAAVGFGAGAVQAILIAQWICQPTSTIQMGVTRGISLGRLGAALLSRERRLTAVVMTAATLCFVHVLIGTKIMQTFSVSESPTRPSYLALCLGAAAWIVLLSSEVRERLTRAFR
jgi:hypothetical protein